MKIRTMLVVAMGLGLATGAGCKKKKTEDTGGGSAAVGSAAVGSADTGSAGSAAEPAKVEPKTGEALAQAYLDCTNLINEGKLDDFKTNCLAEGYTGHEAGDPEPMTADKFVAEFTGYREAFPDMKLQPQLVLVNGRDILAVSLVTGTHTGPMKSPMGELPATNKKMGWMMFHRLTMNDENKNTEEWSYADPATIMGQLGLMPKEAPPVRPAIEQGMEGAPVIVVAADDEKEKANLEAAKKWTETFNTHKIADIVGMYTADAVESDQAGGKDYTGTKEIKASAEMFIKAFPDVKVTDDATFAAGDYVVMLGTFEGTNTGPMGPMKPTKKKVTGKFAEVLEMKDGKIAKLWRFHNGMDMAMQLGLMPAPGAPGGDAPAGDPKAAPEGATMKKGG